MAGDVRLTYAGHSTVLVELDGVRLLTDPVLRERIGLLRRLVPVPPPETTARLDAVLVSHAHWDHLDVPSLARLDRGTLLVVPRGTAGIVAGLGFDRVVELTPGERTAVGPVTVTATPAAHAGSRPPRWRAVALGYLVEGSQRVYFAGDTDLFDGMAAIADGVDVALLPISGWGPTLGRGHLDPERAARAAALVGARHVVPIHWGSIALAGTEGLATRRASAPDDLARAAAELAPRAVVHRVEPGGSVTLRPRGAPSGST